MEKLVEDIMVSFSVEDPLIPLALLLTDIEQFQEEETKDNSLQKSLTLDDFLDEFGGEDFGEFEEF